MRLFDWLRRMVKKDALTQEQYKVPCHWPFSTLVVLSDQTVVCGCTDPGKTRILGSLSQHTAADIWSGSILGDLRSSFAEGRTHAYCSDCHLYRWPTEPGVNIRTNAIETGPAILQVEPCVRCNLRCPTAHCDLNNQGGTRDFDMLSFADFERIFDQVASTVQLLRIYNYGEPFLNPETTRMISYARQKRPDIFIDTHTNGLLLNAEAKRQAFVECGLDFVVFSIDGFRQASYEKYRKRGKIQVVLDNLKEVIRLRNALGLRQPQICWRYILFNWNDSNEEMADAVEYASEIGVDFFAWHLNSGDPTWSSERFQPGTEDFERIKHAIWDVGGIRANAIRTPRPNGHPSPLYDAAVLQIEEGATIASPSETVHLHVKASNSGTTSWRAGEGGRGIVRIGALVYADRRGKPIAEFRSSLRTDVHPGDSCILDFPIQSPSQPGEYVVQLDMVNEFMSWFSAQGSRRVEYPLTVQSASTVSFKEARVTRRRGTPLIGDT